MWNLIRLTYLATDIHYQNCCGWCIDIATNAVTVNNNIGIYVVDNIYTLLTNALVSYIALVVQTQNRNSCRVAVISIVTSLFNVRARG